MGGSCRHARGAHPRLDVPEGTRRECRHVVCLPSGGNAGVLDEKHASTAGHDFHRSRREGSRDRGASAAVQYHPAGTRGPSSVRARGERGLRRRARCARGGSSGVLARWETRRSGSLTLPQRRRLVNVAGRMLGQTDSSRGATRAALSDAALSVLWMPKLRGQVLPVARPIEATGR